MNLPPEAIAGFLGAVVGSLGGVFLEYSLGGWRERRQDERRLVERYLLQLQNAVETLFYRLINIAQFGGRALMSDSYYRVSSLYALASVLAHAQIMFLDGVYARLDYFKGLKAPLRRKLLEIDRILDDSRFLHYHRLALAEAVIEKTADRSRVASYLRFHELLDADETVKKAIGPANSFVDALDHATVKLLMDRLKEVVFLLEGATSMPSSLRFLNGA